MNSGHHMERFKAPRSRSPTAAACTRRILSSFRRAMFFAYLPATSYDGSFFLLFTEEEEKEYTKLVVGFLPASLMIRYVL